MGARDRISDKVCFFEHDVHDGLCAHDPARFKTQIQDGFAARLRQRYPHSGLAGSGAITALPVSIRDGYPCTLVAWIFTKNLGEFNDYI